MKKYYKVFIVMLLISIIMCSGFIFHHYATDDFNLMNIGYNNFSIYNNLREGRPIIYLIEQLYSRLNISYDVFLISTIIIAIIITCINIILLFTLIKQYTNKKDERIIFIILFSTIFNFMYIENLYFPESITMALSLLLYTLSAKYFFNNNKYHILKTFFFAILATFCYNGLECYYISLITFLSLIINDNNYKQLLIDIIKAGLIILLSVVLNFIQMQLSCKLLNLPDQRTIRNDGIFINLFFLVFYLIPETLIISSYLLPKYLYLISLLVLIILSLVIEKKSNIKYFSFNTLILLLICISSSFCISIISLSSFGTGRLLFGVGMSIGIILLYMYIKIDNKNKYKNTLIIISIIWTLINIFNYTYRTNHSKYLNEVEKKEILKLDKEIKEYEKENNIKVTDVVCANPYIRKEVSDIDASALKTEWSTAGVINYYTGRNIKKVKINSKQNKKYLKILKNKEYILYNNKIIVKIYDWQLS